MSESKVNAGATVQERIFRAVGSEDIPKIYFNGFVNSLGTGDVLVVLERNGAPVATLNISYTVAKTLSAALGEVVDSLEKATGQSMLTTHKLEEALATESEKNG